MIIQTTNFGELEIDEKEILQFPEGIYAFEHVKRFVIFKIEDDDSPVLWLQAVDERQLNFVVFDPYMIKPDYAPDLTREDLDKLGAAGPDDLKFVVIAVTPQDLNDMTVNLKSPIAINPANHTGLQVILDRSEYPIRHRLFARQSNIREVR